MSFDVSALKEKPKPPRKSKLAIGFVLFFFAALVFYSWQVEPFWIEYTEHLVRVKAARSYTIVHLSDLHMSSIGRRERDVIDFIERREPDIVVISGDSIADGAEPDAVVEFISNLKTRIGTYVVSGNWEHWRPSNLMERLSRLERVHPLDNASLTVDGGLTIIGLDDSLAGSPSEERAYKTVPSEGVRILVFHSPEIFDSLKERFDLAFAGHTHGGQIRFPGLPPFFLPRGSGPYVEGLYERDGRKMYVSRGLGTSVLPARLFARPEVAFFQIVGEMPARGR